MGGLFRYWIKELTDRWIVVEAAKSHDVVLAEPREEIRVDRGGVAYRVEFLTEGTVDVGGYGIAR